MSSPGAHSVLPEGFYSGKRRAHTAIGLVVLVVLASAGTATAAGRLDLLSIIGPHVQRSEWAFSMVGARELVARGLTGRGVTVCVVDSGVDFMHPDFAQTSLLAWKDLVNFRPDAYDDSGHGTAMAGLIAAHGSLRGVAPGVQLIAVKVVNSAGDGSSQNVADGIRFCVYPWANNKRGADIISISLGSKAHLFVENAVYQAASWATSQGVFVVASAGNDGLVDDGDVEIPANVPMAIAVGAVDVDGSKAPFTSIGAIANRTNPDLKPEVVAPGVRLVSTAPGAHYVTVTGTSPAAAIVSGVLALILEARPDLRPTGTSGNILTLKTALAHGARKFRDQAIPHDPWYGYGIINGPSTLDSL